jgi:hypothetical protein
MRKLPRNVPEAEPAAEQTVIKVEAEAEIEHHAAVRRQVKEWSEGAVQRKVEELKAEPATNKELLEANEASSVGRDAEVGAGAVPSLDELTAGAVLCPKAAVVLNSGAPKDVANEFVQRECSLGGRYVVLFWNKQFWRWNGRFWAVEDERVLAGKLSEFLDGAYKKDKGGNLIRFMPKKTDVEGVLYFVEQGLAINSSVVPPVWLESEEPAVDWIVCRNMLVNAMTEEMRELTPDLFALGGVDWDWNGKAECPLWMQFLEEVFPGDKESQDFIEEWGGCNMTSHTALHTAAMFVGDLGRNGKNTITNVYSDIVGAGNYVDCELNTWIHNGKKSENLLGKARDNLWRCSVEAGK